MSDATSFFKGQNCQTKICSAFSFDSWKLWENIFFSKKKSLSNVSAYVYQIILAEQPRTRNATICLVGQWIFQCLHFAQSIYSSHKFLTFVVLGSLELHVSQKKRWQGPSAVLCPLWLKALIIFEFISKFGSWRIILKNLTSLSFIKAGILDKGKGGIGWA